MASQLSGEDQVIEVKQALVLLSTFGFRFVLNGEKKFLFGLVDATTGYQWLEGIHKTTPILHVENFVDSFT